MFSALFISVFIVFFFLLFAVVLCFHCSQAALSRWEWNPATSRTTRLQLRVSSGPSTWTCSPGSPGRPGWTNKARSTLGRQDTATSHSGCRYDPVGAVKVGFGETLVSTCWKMRADPAGVRTVGVCSVSPRPDLIDVFAVRCDADSTFESPTLSSRHHS